MICNFKLNYLHKTFIFLHRYIMKFNIHHIFFVNRYIKIILHSFEKWITNMEVLFFIIEFVIIFKIYSS